MISVKHLVKRYDSGSRTAPAVNDVSFHIEQGQVAGFVGPNGAGKSTTLRILAGFVAPTSGSVTIAGFDVERQSLQARQQLGYMPESSALYPEMRVNEYLRFRAELKQVPRAKRRAAVSEALDAAGISDVADACIKHLSKGYKQRVCLADALVARPPVLILDEPTSGLDPNQIREMRDVIRGLGQNHTVVISTHVLSEVEAMCNRVLLIAKGKLVAESAVHELAKKRRATGVAFVVRGDVAASVGAVQAALGRAACAPTVHVPSPREGRPDDGVHEIRCAWTHEPERDRQNLADPQAQTQTLTSTTLSDDEASQRATEQAVQALVRAGCAVRAVRSLHDSLEDVFAQLTEVGHRETENRE